MKVTDIRRKLIATLAAGGLLAPAAVEAANLDTNLVVNPGFELIDFGTTGAYGAPTVLNWTGGGLAFSHDTSGGIPDYANGTDPLNGGSWYFAPGYTTTGGTRHHTLATAITQVINVGSGPSATLIASGAAKYSLGADFSTYTTQTDHGVVQLDFLNASETVLGTGVVTPGPTNLPEWTPLVAGGPIPVGTTSVRVSAWGVLNQGAASDGYIDNIDFQVTTNLPALSIDVNRSTGAITLRNQTGSAKNISTYSIVSAFGGLSPSNWLSIADNYDSGNPGPNQVDPAHAWEESSTPGSNVDLTEHDPAIVGATLAANRSVNLGNAWIANPTEDLSFEYTSDGLPVSGIVNYIGGDPRPVGDVNADGAITSADWVIVRTNQHTNLAGNSPAEAYRLGDFNGDFMNDHADFKQFKDLYDAANGAGAFAAMVAAVPEPASLSIVFSAGLLLLSAARGRTRT